MSFAREINFINLMYTCIVVMGCAPTGAEEGFCQLRAFPKRDPDQEVQAG